jgi:threonine/homoserine/homoserine lactone efflux protein
VATEDSAWSSLLTALAIGLAVASAPGPVQAIVVAEAMRGGIGRGLAATAGAAAAFAGLLLLVVLGMSVAGPSGTIVRLLEAVGGAVLIWFAVDAYRSAKSAVAPSRATSGPAPKLPPPVRIALAVLIFPGTWIFVAGIASPLISAARASGGSGVALAVAVGLVFGATVGNIALSVVSGWGRRVAAMGTVTRIRQALAVVLGLIGLGMLASAALDFAA